MKTSLNKVVAGLLVVAGLVSGCNGHHTTEPNAAPKISNLKTLGFTRFDANTGEVPLSFDFVAPDASLTSVLVTFPTGTATNPPPGASGRTMGTISMLQDVVLPSPPVHQLNFSVQVEDSRGNLSNVLTGQVAIP
jgi:hypothetical protein